MCCTCTTPECFDVSREVKTSRPVQHQGCQLPQRQVKQALKDSPYPDGFSETSFRKCFQPFKTLYSKVYLYYRSGPLVGRDPQVRNRCLHLCRLPPPTHLPPTHPTNYHPPAPHLPIYLPTCLPTQPPPWDLGRTSLVGGMWV